MSEEINAIQSYTPVGAVVRTDHENYRVTIGETNLLLRRNIDFGRIPKAQRPSLYKSGAERILMAYGVESKFVLEKAVEEFGNADGAMPLFFYRFKCELYKGGQHITDGYGSANSNEGSCGRAPKADLANSVIKKAKKRSMVDACLMLAQLSGAFTADLEDSTLDTTDFAKVAQSVTRPDDKISAKQVKRLYTLCTQNSVDSETAAKIIADAGYDSAKSILNRDYDEICNKIESFSETVVEGEVVK